jgi:hypothetical protein
MLLYNIWPQVPHLQCFECSYAVKRKIN